MNPRENAFIAYRHETPDWVPARSLDFNVIFPAPYVERYQGTGVGKDWFGVTWQYEPLTKAPMPLPGQPMLADIEDWRGDVLFPDLDSIDWEKQAKQDMRFCDPDKITMAMSINGMFERMHSCMGMENTLCALLENPEECYNFAGAIADHKIRMIQKLKCFYEIDVFDMNDDYGMNDRMFMSLDTWRTIFKPHLKRIVTAAHECGMIYEHHSCGYIEPLVGDLVEIGVDALDVWQVCNKNMRSLKDQYQKVLTFCGGFDSQGVFDRQDATYEDCYRETARVLNLMAPGGSYIAFTITIGNQFVPPFNQAVNEIGRTIYRQL